MKILIILGSTREGRVGDKVAEWVVEKSRELNGVEFEFIDLRDWRLPYYDEPRHPSMVKLGECPENHVDDWKLKVKEADGYLVVTPEYNHGYPAVLKSALDYPYNEWNKKPIGFVSYGGLAGGARAVEQLRQVSIELQMVPIKDSVAIPAIKEKIDGAKFLNNERNDENLETVFDELIWWAKALKRARLESRKESLLSQQSSAIV